MNYIKSFLTTKNIQVYEQIFFKAQSEEPAQ